MNTFDCQRLPGKSWKRFVPLIFKYQFRHLDGLQHIWNLQRIRQLHLSIVYVNSDGSWKWFQHSPGCNGSSKDEHNEGRISGFVWLPFEYAKRRVADVGSRRSVFQWHSYYDKCFRFKRSARHASWPFENYLPWYCFARSIWRPTFFTKQHGLRKEQALSGQEKALVFISTVSLNTESFKDLGFSDLIKLFQYRILSKISLGFVLEREALF